MNKSLKEQLIDIYGKPKRKKDKPVRRKPQNQRSEVLTDWDIKDLMGINKATYRRGKGGAFKQR